MIPWLAIVGIGEDGLSGVAPVGRALVADAEVLIGGARHLAMVPETGAERHPWPKPLSELADRIPAMRGRRVCVLASGDPLHYGIGAVLARKVPAEEMTVVPSPSAFALAAARLAWPLETTALVSLHAFPVETLALHVAPDARLLILARDATTAPAVAEWLVAHGFGDSRMIALAHMGGEKAARLEAAAKDWGFTVPSLHTLAVECIAGPDARWFPRTAGLADSAFKHDGNMTKRESRALAIAKLMPHRGALLIDIGCGCGSMAVEWMRAADGARAIGLEPNPKRRVLAAHNASALGVPDLDIRPVRAPQGLSELPAADAIFIGGGIGPGTLSTAIDALKPGGRLVAHAVTLTSEALLANALAKRGGELVRYAVDRAEIGEHVSMWRPARPITQWAWTKPWEPAA